MVSNERGDVVYGEEAAVFLGDIFEASAAYAGLDKFDAQTDVTIDLGLEEIFSDPDAVAIVEWAERLGPLTLRDAVQVHLSYIDEHIRRIEVRSGPGRLPG